MKKFILNKKMCNIQFWSTREVNARVVYRRNLSIFGRISLRIIDIDFIVSGK